MVIQVKKFSLSLSLLPIESHFDFLRCFFASPQPLLPWPCMKLWFLPPCLLSAVSAFFSLRLELPGLLCPGEHCGVFETKYPFRAFYAFFGRNNVCLSPESRTRALRRLFSILTVPIATWLGPGAFPASGLFFSQFLPAFRPGCCGPFFLILVLALSTIPLCEVHSAFSAGWADSFPLADKRRSFPAERSLERILLELV